MGICNKSWWVKYIALFAVSVENLENLKKTEKEEDLKKKNQYNWKYIITLKMWLKKT